MTILILHGDRANPIIHTMQRLMRQWPRLRRAVRIELWDGYPFQWRICDQTSRQRRDIRH